MLSQREFEFYPTERGENPRTKAFKSDFGFFLNSKIKKKSVVTTGNVISKLSTCDLWVSTLGKYSISKIFELGV